MHEAVILALIGFCYAAFISFTSMGVSMFFGQRDLLQIGHAIVLIVFVGGGMGFIAWTKQHFGHPLVNVACSLASLACVSVLVKEGTVQAGEFSDDRVIQILIMVIMGIFVTTLVNLVVLPIKARRRLHKDLVKDTELLGELLVNTTRAFLVGEEDILKEGKSVPSVFLVAELTMNNRKQDRERSPGHSNINAKKPRGSSTGALLLGIRKAVSHRSQACEVSWPIVSELGRSAECRVYSVCHSAESFGSDHRCRPNAILMVGWNKHPEQVSHRLCLMVRPFRCH